MKKVLSILSLILTLALLTGCNLIGQSDNTEPISNLIDATQGSAHAISTTEEVTGHLVEVPGRVYTIRYDKDMAGSVNDAPILSVTEIQFYRYTQEDLDGAFAAAEKLVSENSIVRENSYTLRIGLDPWIAYEIATESASQGEHQDWALENYYAHWIGFQVTVEYTQTNNVTGEPQQTRITYPIAFYRSKTTDSNLWRAYIFNYSNSVDPRSFLTREELAAYESLGGEPIMGYYVEPGAYYLQGDDYDNEDAFEKTGSYHIYVYDAEKDQIFCHILRENSHEISECTREFGGSQ